ncbi:F0F1 ATP synthase subunit delta [Lysobacter korlensis]|uniref:ATP synthase subunit delta n=1 Tax=Lysobacter korlensis TaxID=553636 RepID=A0ABV6S2Y5_9GAMM
MRAATRQALAASRAALEAVRPSLNLRVGEELFAAGRLIGETPALRTALTETAVDPDDKRSIVGRVFGTLGAPARSVLSAVVSNDWSSPDDLLAAIEELGIRAIAASAPAGGTIENELFAFGSVVGKNAEVELALSNKLASGDAKAALVNTLLSGKASEETLAIARQLVRQPRGRRINELVRSAAKTVADESGLQIATVTSAAPITADQLARLQTTLTTQYGRPVGIHWVLDPELVGGLRIQVGDDVVDGSIASRLHDLRLQLAG